MIMAAATPALGITILGHRGTSKLDIPENSKIAFEYARHADMLETDVRWTRDPYPGDPVMVLSHDSTLDRVFNCKGDTEESYVYVSQKYWPWIRDNCRTRIASQPMMTLPALVAFAKQTGQHLDLEIKQGDISDWKARQFYNAVKDLNGRVLVTAFDGPAMRSLKKVKALDAADGSHRLRYGLTVNYLPTIAQVKAVGWNLMINKYKINADQVAAFRAAGIHVYLWTGYTEADYALMTDMNPNGVIVDDPEAYYTWLNG
jgi:glycerophosphoryl diester phosphodiesterase